MPISPTTGVALGAVFGFIFVFTCIISAIKAVRDRKKIKKRIAERERRASGSDVKNRKCDSSIEEAVAPLPSSSKSNKNGKNTNGRQMPVSGQPVSLERLEMHETKTKRGVDNLTYAHSHSDIKRTTNGDCSDKPSQSKYSAACETTAMNAHAQRNIHAPTSRTLSNDAVERRGGSQTHLNDFSPECLAVQKLLRRHSYDMAVCEHSWLPSERPSFQTSNKIIQTYCYGRPRTNGFENRAFNSDDRRKL